MTSRVLRRLLILIVFLACIRLPAAWAQSPQPGDVLWSNPLDSPSDLSGSDGKGTLEPVDGRTALRINLADNTTSALRTFDLPAGTLRGKWIFLTASVKAAGISPKALDWNGVKVMLKVERPGGTQWPQISIPDGSFDWNLPSTRILIPADATGVTLFLGLELVTGTAWFDDVRVTLSRVVRDVPAAPPDQPVFRGHPLPSLRGAMAHPRMTREDMRVFAGEWGGNLLRWQLVRFPDPDTANDLALYDQWLTEELDYLDLVLTWAKELGVMIVVDLHSPPGGRVGSGGGMAGGTGQFWSTPASQQHFVTVWQRITTRYKNHPMIWGFDLLNEPDDREVTWQGVDWQTLSKTAATAVRAIDPGRTIIVEPNMWGSAEGFLGFEPLDLPNIVYSCHVYTPFTYTHQGLDAPSTPIPYPGVIDEEMWDKARLESSLAPAIAFAEKHRVHMYIGEFSAIRWAPGADTYLKDLIEIFEAHRWDWSYHSFREWHGWNLELGTDRDDMNPSTGNPRLQAILGKTRMNARPQTTTSKVFPADAVLDITRPPYNARPDDGIDDTAAIQQAITDVTDVTDTGRFIYFPAGTYLVSNTLVSKNTAGIWRAMVTLQGEDRGRTVLKLGDNTPGFGDPANPKAILMTGSIMDAGEPDTGGGGNKAFRNNVMDLTIDTGSGNAGAIGIEWAASNWGTIKDVTIRSGDGTGHAGLSMRRRIPGPGYVKRVAIEGFNYGIDVSDIQYGFTLEHVHVRDQKIAGIRLDRNLLHIRKLTSDNAVPAIVTSHSESALTLVDSHFRGTAPGVHALQTGGNHLLVTNLTLDPPASSRIRGQIHAATGHIGILTDPAPLPADPSPSLQAGPSLPVEEAPEFWNANTGDWAAVGARQSGENDDTAAIQRAIDSGKSTVYLPINRTYFVSDTLIVRGAVRQFLGMGSEISLGAAQLPFGNPAAPRPLFRIEPTTHEEIIFEHLFLNTQYPGVILFENHSPKTVVIRHSGGWIGSGMHKRSYHNNANANGKVFIEDVFMPGWDFSGQRVWARQLNPENQEGDGSVPQVRNSGGSLWILGFKTEGQAPFIITENHAATELLGAYNYVSATFTPTVPVTAVPYVIKDSRAFLSFTTDNFRDDDYAVYIRTQSGTYTKDWTREQMPPRNGAPGYRSFSVPWFHGSAATFGTWLERHFTPAQRENPAISGPLASPANDGVANLLKYHLGLDPWQPGSGFTPVMESNAANGTFILRYPRSAAAPDATGTIEWSTTLQAGDWHTEGITESISSAAGAIEQAEISIPKNNRDRLFLRLKVVKTTP